MFVSFEMVEMPRKGKGFNWLVKKQFCNS